MKLRIVHALTTGKNTRLSQILLRCHDELKKRSSFLIIVLIPWAFIAFYLAFIKTPIYESTASVLIHHYAAYSPISGLKSVFSKNKQENIDPDSAPIFLMQRYIHSQEMLTELQKSTDITHHFQSTDVDWISRLKKYPNQKEFLDYYVKKVTLSLDATTGELVMTVKAFSPAEAHEFLTVILDKAAQFLKKTNHDSAVEQSQLMQNNLEQARQKFILAETTLHNTIKNNKGHGVKISPVLEQQKLDLKFAKIEYESYQQAYVLWSLSIKKNTPVQTSAPNVPDYYSYPKIPSDLINLLAIFTALFLLGKMLLLLVKEHSD